MTQHMGICLGATRFSICNTYDSYTEYRMTLTIEVGHESYRYKPFRRFSAYERVTRLAVKHRTLLNALGYQATCSLQQYRCRRPIMAVTPSSAILFGTSLLFAACAVFWPQIEKAYVKQFTGLGGSNSTKCPLVSILARDILLRLDSCCCAVRL